jgi:transposase
VIRLGELVMILDLHRQGLSVSAIARQLERDRKTVRKYIERGLAAPAYNPREPRPAVVTPFAAYLRDRIAAFSELTGSRLLREIRELGYAGGYTAVKDFLRTIRPRALQAFERRFETPPGKQAQVDFAFFRTVFTDQPDAERIIWLFSMVLGHNRMMWGRFVAHQDLQTVLCCHIGAFEALGGAPAEILYDRMKTAVLGEVDDQGIVYNRKLLDLAAHYRFLPKACPPYRAKTKGKVERPFRYVREDFFRGGSFRNLDDLNGQFRRWLDTVANPRRHATTGRVVLEHFAEEKPYLKALPAMPFTGLGIRPADHPRRHGVGWRQSVLGPRQHPPPGRRGAYVGQRDPHSERRQADRCPSRSGRPRSASHRWRPSHGAAAEQ